MAVQKISTKEIDNYIKKQTEELNQLKATEYLKRRSFGFEDELLNVLNNKNAYANFKDFVFVNNTQQKAENNDAVEVSANIKSQNSNAINISHLGEINIEKHKKTLTASETNLNTILKLESFSSKLNKLNADDNDKINATASKHCSMLAKFIKDGNAI